ncbi:hypothetical protein CHS0354_032150 [Potamilus streckersoni]|uniref:Uncharacterized protein n=1 Tax=Potamilus streckersoni TaxID=2493646 RepID=A0AAE0WDC8_9BIVA|nr:hypothetical protein CHS0354_032150 [Potamilus streckersoni]
MATATTDSSLNDERGCPICLDGFTSPRQLPCLHSFCEHCLQDYVTKMTSSTYKTIQEFMCPVCRAVTRPANKEKPVREWASLFPNSPFPLVGKSKVERCCEVCWNSSDKSKNLAKKFCIVCEEYMCDNCAVYHQNMKMTKSHELITIEQLENNPENRIRFSEGFGCPEHGNEDIKFYCRNHETACCGTCFFLDHKACQNVLQLKENLSGLLKEVNSQKIMEQLRKLEAHLENFMEMNDESIGIMESHVNNISADIGDIRKKFNDVLDNVEKMVKLEGNRIYKDWLIRKQEQNYQCQSLVRAIGNSHSLLKTIGQYGSDTQKFLVNSKTLKQLRCYSNQIREKFEKVDSIRTRLELDSNMKAVLSKNAVGLVKIVCEEEVKDLQCTSLVMPVQKRNVELSRVIDLHSPSENPLYFGIVQLPDGNIVLADSKNSTCCLYDSSYNFITSHKLPGKPDGMCLLGDNELVVTMPAMKMVQFCSIWDRTIRDTGTLAIKYKCVGVDAVNRMEIVVSGPANDTRCNNKCYWSLINRNGNVKLHHEFDCRETSYTFVALNMSKSRVYISVNKANAVYCFGLTDGKRYFVYLSNDLRSPRCITVDSEDNVYVVGFSSNNIHKLSPDGVKLQIIASGIPEKPRGISFSYSREHFVITNIGLLNSKLHYFVNK